jgi:hypothetical protein
MHVPAPASRTPIQKISFTFTDMAGNAVYKGFPPFCAPEFTFSYLSPNLHQTFTRE